MPEFFATGQRPVATKRSGQKPEVRGLSPMGLRRLRLDIAANSKHIKTDLFTTRYPKQLLDAIDSYALPDIPACIKIWKMEDV